MEETNNIPANEQTDEQYNALQSMLGEDFYDTWYNRINKEEEGLVLNNPFDSCCLSAIEEIISRILPCEETQDLISLLNKAIERKKEMDFWLSEAQKWLNQQKITTI